MDYSALNRTHLETLSTLDLISIAEEWGIDIPEGLNRRFIIGELLELAAENTVIEEDSTVLVDALPPDSAPALPDTYNETSISVLLRDPGWVFVFWDFHTTLYTALTSNPRFESFFLRVSLLSSPEDGKKIVDYFDVDVGTTDRKWYVHLPERSYAYRVDLYTRNSQEKEQMLAKSIELIVPCGLTNDSPEGRRRVSPLLDLSGITELRKAHFRNHRQSFS